MIPCCNDCPSLDDCLEKADWDNDEEWYEKCQSSCPYGSWFDYEVAE